MKWSKKLGSSEHPEKVINSIEEGGDALNTFTEGYLNLKEVLKKEDKPNPNVTHCETCKTNYYKNADGTILYDSTSKKAGETTTNHGKQPDRKTKN